MENAEDVNFTKSLGKVNHIKKTAKTIDSFVWKVLSEAQARVRNNFESPDYSKGEFMSQLNEVYDGKLGSRQKSMIAASLTSVDSWSQKDEISIGSTSAKKVKKQYKELFGTANPKIDLPKVSPKTDTEKYYFDYAQNGTSKVFCLAYDDERDCTGKTTKAEKTGRNSYSVTRRYKFYEYWGTKVKGEPPTQIVTAIITLKKKASSPYGYNIVGITFQ